jgi:magnesium-transporting ATPase (P-type)
MQEMLAGDLVPGDTVYISLGDRVPADIRLTEVRNFRGLHTHSCLFCLNSFNTTHTAMCG